jgi:hypothetical protein
MKTITVESTSETDALIDAMPPEHAVLVRRACDAYSKQCAKALQGTAAHSNKVRTGIANAIKIHRHQLEVLPHHGRTSFLMKRLEVNPVKYGLKQTPDRDLVKTLMDEVFKIDPDF